MDDDLMRRCIVSIRVIANARLCERGLITIFNVLSKIHKLRLNQHVCRTNAFLVLHFEVCPIVKKVLDHVEPIVLYCKMKRGVSLSCEWVDVQIMLQVLC
jgi:hypothetical protein